MKKVLSLFIIVVCLFLVGCSSSSKTIEEIVGVNFDEIDHIKIGGASSQDNDYDVSEFVDHYRDLEYKKISGSYGNTAHEYFVCYDADDKVLFTLVEIGNQEKVFIKKGSFDINKDASSSLYQLDE